MYKLETHAHTTEGSACAHASAAQLCRAYKKAGYDGLFITDHFYYGNTAVPRTLPWRDWVAGYCTGYRRAREVGKKIGIDVFFGWEAGYCGTDFLIYGLDESWLLTHPEVIEWSVDEQFYHISRAGGLVVHAHPFREAPYLPRIQLYPDYVHAVEGINTGNAKREFNQKAVAYANKHGLPLTGGSDTHSAKLTGGGMLFAEPIRNEKDFVTAVLTRRKAQILGADTCL
ncbi:MAG: PHP domain-containing protein [Clostridia bacterium]|nr:PHP domain-containing protein [Clostridia bacterium]MDY5559414.1 PHP domain-containing protein [Candidatus Heritagella sp.]